MNKRAVQFVVVLFAMAVSARGQEIASVDLTKPPELPTGAEPTQKTPHASGCEGQLQGGNADGHVLAAKGHQRPEIAVEIARVNDYSPPWGSELMAEVHLRNVGKEQIHIPWGLDLEKVQAAQHPSHLRWEEGQFEVRLDGTMLANRSRSLYSSESLTGSGLAVPSGGWITATIKFKLENAFFPDRFSRVVESELSVEWRQAARSRDIADCKMMIGYWDYEDLYVEKNPTMTIHVNRDNRSDGNRRKD